MPEMAEIYPVSLLDHFGRPPVCPQLATSQNLSLFGYNMGVHPLKLNLVIKESE